MAMARNSDRQTKRNAGSAPKPPSKLKIEYWPVSRLKEYANNPRDNDGAVERMSDAIRQFGFKVPVVATSDGAVVDGHLRLKAARSIGLETVPVVLADDLSDAQIRAFRIQVNQATNWADWDPIKLREELAELEPLGFTPEMIGFDPDELPELIGTDPVPTTPRKPGNKTTLFISIKNSESAKARNVIAAALKKAKIEATGI